MTLTRKVYVLRVRSAHHQTAGHLRLLMYYGSRLNFEKRCRVPKHQPDMELADYCCFTSSQLLGLLEGGLTFFLLKFVRFQRSYSSTVKHYLYNI